MGEMIRKDGAYNENVIRNNVDTILIFHGYITICCKDGLQFNIRLIKEVKDILV